MTIKKYRKNENQIITAVQLNLELDGFKYEKWGAKQQCLSGDWLVQNNGDCYTISQKSFAETYTSVSPGRYVKTGTVWAELAESSGVVQTQEGSTEYSKGDYLVSNNADGTDAYAVSKEKFEAMYVLKE